MSERASAGTSATDTAVYVLAELTVHDRERYQTYARRFPDVLARFGGRLLAADDRPHVAEGAFERDRVVLLEFPSREACDAWSSSNEYRAIASDRIAATEGTVLVLRGHHRVPDAPRYDAIGANYARLRREDPRVMARIEAALGSAQTVLNVGAGAGSYEPKDRCVLAVEPSDVMAAQRPSTGAPALRASAGSIPLRDNSMDAAIAVLSLHHWDAEQERGVRELRRIARGPVVLLTIDPMVSGAMWLMQEYLHEVREVDRRIFPAPEVLARWLGGDVRVDIVPVARDTPDWTLLSYWAHPERVLDPDARAATSGFARMPQALVERVVAEVTRDLESGIWDARHGALRELVELDVGLRLVVAQPSAR